MTPAATAFPGIRPPSDVNPRTEPVLDFPDREYGSLAPADYAALGFLGGLEVHQQLLTRRKLFCRCPAGRYVDRADGEVLRHMRPTLSELGEAYVTALAEHRRILREAFARHSGVEVGTGGRCLLRLRGARGFRGPRAGFRGFPPTADRRLRRRAGPQYEREDRFS